MVHPVRWRTRAETERGICAVLFLPVLLFMLASAAFAQDEADNQVYKYPEIAPEYSLWGGFTDAHLNGGSNALPYGYASDSLGLGGEIIAFPFPNRVHLELDVLNKKDYFADFRYAYSDTVLFRFLGSSLFHNLPNIALAGNPSRNGSDLDQSDTGVQYGVRMGINRVSLRFKTHDYPFHIYLQGMNVVQSGDMQQIFLGGSGSFSDIVRVSQDRPVDMRTTDIRVGLNGHLGPVEMDYSHGFKRFSAGNEVMSYTNDSGVSWFHNLIPELEGNTDTFRIHSSYTGMIYAMGTLSKISRTNDTSGARADYFFGDGEIRVIPVTPLMLVARYKHEELSEENISSTLNQLYSQFNLPPPALINSIRPPISSVTDTVTGVARYRITYNLSVGSQISWNNERRENSTFWEDGLLPASTRSTRTSFNVDYRPVRMLKLRGQYTHEWYGSPAYNYQPNNGDAGTLSATWSFPGGITAFASYELSHETRDNVLIIDETTSGITNAANRDVRRDKFSGDIVFPIRRNITLDAGYAYWRSKVRQDLVYTGPAGAQFLDPNVPYTDISHNYTVSANYTPVDKLELTGAVNRFSASGDFSPSSQYDFSNGPSLLPLSVFSTLDIKETVYSFKARWAVRKKTEIGLSYFYSDFDSAVNSLNPEYQSGHAHAFFASLTRRW